jgi:hypothetical protein
MLKVIMLSVILLSVILLSVILLSVILLSVILLSVILLSVILLIVTVKKLPFHGNQNLPCCHIRKITSYHKSIVSYWPPYFNNNHKISVRIF